MSGDNTVFGRDRPERGSALHLVLDGVPLLSSAGSSSESELVATVPVTRDGRRPRLPLGAELAVSWGWRGTVRTRPYRILDVATGGTGRADWRLAPLDAAAEGTRRAVPRFTLALPAVLVVAGARLSGGTVDISVGGVRLAFPPASAAEEAGLLEAGEHGELALLLDGDRVRFPAVVVRSAVLRDGSRDVRVYLDGGAPEDRDRLHTFVRAAAPPELDVPAGPAPEGPQSNDVPVSAS